MTKHTMRYENFTSMPDVWHPYDDWDTSPYRRSQMSVVAGKLRFDVSAPGGPGGVAGWFGPKDALYGKFSLGVQAFGAGTGAAIMLWPTSDVWGEGEIDYPEGDFDSTMSIFHHGITPVAPETNVLAFDTGRHWNVHHYISIEWTPDKVAYWMDGKILKTVTDVKDSAGNITERRVPITPHRFTVQTAPKPNSKPGYMLIDSVVIEQVLA
jgi:hypothetical protein